MNHSGPAPFCEYYDTGANVCPQPLDWFTPAIIIVIGLIAFYILLVLILKIVKRKHRPVKLEEMTNEN